MALQHTDTFVPRPDGAGLLAELLDLRAAFPDVSVVPVFEGGRHPTILCKQIQQGSTIADTLNHGQALLVSGFIKRASGFWVYFSSVDVASSAQGGQYVDPAVFEPSRAIRLSHLPTANRLWSIFPWNSTGDLVLCWNIDWTNARQAEGQRLLRFAVDLVVFNALTRVARLQTSLENAMQQFEKRLTEFTASSLLKEMAKGSLATDEISSQTAVLMKSETSLLQEQREHLPIHELTFMKFLQDPAVSSEVGFRMRLAVVGHPSMPVYEVMQLLLSMEQLGLAVAAKTPLIQHRTVLSDIDDTVHPAHDAQTIAIAGQDTTPLEHGEIYSGIERVHRDLVLHAEDNRVHFPVFLSARPPILARKQKPELQCLARKIAVAGRLPQKRGTIEKDRFCSILPGVDDVGGLLRSFLCILQQKLPGMQKGMVTGLGRTKVERVLQYIRLFPEPSYVFIGDDGQGDFEAARSLLTLTRAQVSAEPQRKTEALPPHDAETLDGGTASKQPSPGLLQAALDVIGQVKMLTSDEDGYVALLRQHLQRPETLPTFSTKDPPVFDFVAIKAVQTNRGYLFSEGTRKQREALMKQIYGADRFFYFEDYDELWKKLKTARWVENN